MKSNEPNYEKLSRCLKGLANELRLKILYYLEDGEKSVSEIEQHTGSSQSNISQHLSLMRDKNILSSRKEAHQIYYFIKNKNILSNIKNLCTVFKKVE